MAIAAANSNDKLTQSADIFGGGTLSSPDSVKTGSTAGSADKAKASESESAKMFGSFSDTIGKLPVVAINSIGAGTAPPQLQQPQPYFNGQPQMLQQQGQMPAAPAAVAANAQPSTTNAAPQNGGGTTVSIGKKPEQPSTPAADAKAKKA